MRRRKRRRKTRKTASDFKFALSTLTLPDDLGGNEGEGESKK